MSIEPASSDKREPAPLEEVGGGSLPPRARRPKVVSTKVWVGGVVLAAFVVLAIIGPLVAPYNPSAIVGPPFAGPSGAHILGTTSTGQDVLSQLLVGTRISMVVGFVAGGLATLLSVIIGVSAGYLGGAADEVLGVLSNVFLVIPALPLVIVLAGYLPSKGWESITLVITVTGWAWGARVLRAQTLSLRHRDFVEAARAEGEGRARIILAEILPHELAVVAANLFGTVTFAILTQASLAFLGLSSASSWSWGTMLYWAQSDNALGLGAWWWFATPGLCIALVGMALVMLNFGIDELINPRLRAAGIGAKKSARPQRRVPAPWPWASRRSSSFKRLAQDLPQELVIRSAKPTNPEDADDEHDQAVLEACHLRVDYGSGADAVHAVDDVSFTLHRGEILGIAGESGSGKSTLAFALSKLLRPPGQIVGGEIIYSPARGRRRNILDLSDAQLRAFRWDNLAIVFQSAMSALNPVFTLRAQIRDVLLAHRPWMSERDREIRIDQLLGLVGISPDRKRAYPHELSGGMRQRAMIALALALDPDVIIMDEPTTALDVVIQHQIVSEISHLREELGFSVIFITHDLSLLIEVADTIVIMYGGRISEVARAGDLHRNPWHPYSHGLLNSFPVLTGPRREVVGIPGYPPDLRGLHPGCPFAPRCPYALAACQTERPALVAVPNSGPEAQHLVACHLYDLGRLAAPPFQEHRPSSVP